MESDSQSPLGPRVSSSKDYAAQQVLWGSSPAPFNDLLPGARFHEFHNPSTSGRLMENQTLAMVSPLNFATPQHVSIVLATVAVLLVLAAAMSPLLPRRPLWLSPFAQQQQAGKRHSRWSFWTVYLGALAMAGFVVRVVSILLPPRQSLEILDAVPWAAVTFMTVIQRPTKTPLTLLTLYLVIFSGDVVCLELARRALRPLDWCNIANVLISLAAILGILAMPMRDPGLVDDGIAKKTPTHTLRSPEDNLTLWGFMTVSWMSPLISRGSKHQLSDEDVWQLPYDFQHDRLHLLFRDLQGTIFKRLFVANGLDLLIISLLGIVESAANLSVPLLLKKLLESIQSGSEHIETSMLFAFAILAVRLVACQSAVFSLWFSRRSYERSRGEMITSIYAKTLARKFFGQPPVGGQEFDASCDSSLASEGDGEDEGGGEDRKPGRLSRIFSWLPFSRRKHDYQKLKQDDEKAKQPATTGKILNLMRNDVYEVAQRFWEFPQVITKPMQFVLSFALIWNLLGWPCLLGLACVGVAQAMNALIIRQLLAVETVRRVATDERLQATSQFVEGIRHLRWYDWQSKWLDRIMGSRQHELNMRVKTGLWRIGITVVNIGSAALFPVATFFAYTFVAKRPLPVEVVFPSLQLFTMLESSFKELPNLITVLLNATIAMRRIEQFMDEPDKEDGPLDHKTTEIDFDYATFSWPGMQTPVLRDLKLSFPDGLTVVFGRVGSGKSALLQAILGELDWCGGAFAIPNDMVGYCAQLPWLQHMSIRDNILFSAPYDAERYSRVLEACALLPDLAAFKHGDLSDMGENGIGLSGGQRARVALARAVYSQSRVLLLDDPFAALDHQTAELIVKKLFRGPLMEERTVVLVTHRVDLCLHLANQMVEVDEGQARVLNHQEASREVEKFLREEEDDEAQDSTHRVFALDMDESQQTAAAIPDKFIEEEHRATGGVMLSVYWTYIKAGMLRWWAALVVVFSVYRLGTLLNYWFLKAWGEAYRDTESSALPGSSLTHPFDQLPNPNVDIDPWLLTYLGIALGLTLVYSASEGLLLLMVYKAAKSLFARVVERVSRANFRFYDVTPVGRLMNRLVSDIGMIDGGIMTPLQQVAWWALAWVSSMVVIASVTPVFLAFSVGMTAWFVYIFMRFLPTSQSLRRLEMVSLSPLMSNFGILLDGLATIRAFKAQPHFQQKNIAVTDAFQKMDHFYWSLQAWLMFRFDALSAFSTFALTVLALYEGLSPGLTAFVLTTASQFVEATHNLCKQYGTLQMDFVSVERVVELLDLEEEPQGNVEPPSPHWPTEADDIIFDNVTLSYAAHLDPSLRDVSFRIPGGSTCAVLGRTGSGKSTLALALLATMHPSSGAIRVGEVCLSDVDVHAWRRRVSFVAQDPVLFPGTLRDNLDPLRQFTDDDCAAVLRRVLGPEWSPASRVDAGGKNLSQGQRQLVGIGRAVLRRSPLVILDEATASIDRDTAKKVHEILRRELQESTVVTIAHRLEAVEGADWFVRLDGGKIVEHGPAREA